MRWRLCRQLPDNQPRLFLFKEKKLHLSYSADAYAIGNGMEVMVNHNSRVTGGVRSKKCVERESLRWRCHGWERDGVVTVDTSAHSANGELAACCWISSNQIEAHRSCGSWSSGNETLNRASRQGCVLYRLLTPHTPSQSVCCTSEKRQTSIPIAD